jgi:hypothetical protein
MPKINALVRRVKRFLAGARGPYGDLRREIAELRHKYDGLAARQNVTQAYYEHRIDLIYRRVIGALAEMLEDRKIVAETVDSVEERFQRLFSTGFGQAVDVDKVKIGDIVSGEMGRGTINSPLTFYGFRVNGSAAEEKGDGILIYGDKEGLAVHGPYLRLSPGDYTLWLSIAPLEPEAMAASDRDECEVEVYSQAKKRVLATKVERVTAELCSIGLSFGWDPDDASGSVVLRVYQRSNVALMLRSISLA